MLNVTLNKSLICDKGIHDDTISVEEFQFEQTLQSGHACCARNNRLSRALTKYNSTVSHLSFTSSNGQTAAFQSYELSRALQDRCRPAVIASDPDECALIRDLQDQQKFRKKLLPLAHGSHLIHWPTFQTTLNVYFHFGVIGAHDDFQAQVAMEEDPLSEINVPKSIIPHPFVYPDPIYLANSSTLKSFQFNLVAISSDSISKIEWHRTLLKQLFEEGKWGIVGETHNFLIPFIICPNQEMPDFVPEHVMRYCFVFCQSGQFVGDLALKFILPFILWTNRHLTEHVTNLTSNINNLITVNPSQAITEFVIAFFDIYNASHHLIIYSPLSTVIARHLNIHQLHASIVCLIQTITNAAQILMAQTAPLHLNASLDASGVVGKLELGCSVDRRYKDYLHYERVEGLLFGGLVWLLASLPENYLDTEYVKDENALKAALDFLLAYFMIFLSERELEADATDTTITVYRFDSESGLYFKSESICDPELETSRERCTSLISHTQSFAAPTQCVSTDAFRFLCLLLEYSASGAEVDRLSRLLQIALRLCLYRILPIRNQSAIQTRRDCFPVFPFKRWTTVVGTDRFGNPKPGWSNPFNPLCLLPISGLSFMQKNRNCKNFSNIFPTYFEVVFQVFYPISNLLKLAGNSLNQEFYNNSEIHEWALKIGEIVIRPLHKFKELTNGQCESFFIIIQNYWKDFNESKFELILKLLSDKFERVSVTKIQGSFGMLKFDGHLQSHGPVSPYENAMSQSYGDPVFEALHLQVPLLLFNPSGISRYLFTLQKFAFDAHPVQRSLNCTPPHCLYIYQTKSLPLSCGSRPPLNRQPQHAVSFVCVSTTGASVSASLSASISFVDWFALERMGRGTLPSHLASLRSLLDSKDPLIELDVADSSSEISPVVSLARSNTHNSSSEVHTNELPERALDDVSERESSVGSADELDYVMVSAGPEVVIESLDQLVLRSSYSD